MRQVIFFLFFGLSLYSQNIKWNDTAYFRSDLFNLSGNPDFVIDNYSMFLEWSGSNYTQYVIRDISTKDKCTNKVFVDNEIDQSNEFRYYGASNQYFWYNSRLNQDSAVIVLVNSDLEKTNYIIKNNLHHYWQGFNVNYTNENYYLVHSWASTDGDKFGFIVYQINNGALVQKLFKSFNASDFFNGSDKIKPEVVFEGVNSFSVGFVNMNNFDKLLINLSPTKPNWGIQYHEFSSPIADDFRNRSYNAPVFQLDDDENPVFSYLSYASGTAEIACYSTRADWVYRSRTPSTSDSLFVPSTLHMWCPAYLKLSADEYLVAFSTFESEISEYINSENGYQRLILLHFQGNIDMFRTSLKDARIFEFPNGFLAKNIHFLADSSIIVSGRTASTISNFQESFLKLSSWRNTSISDSEILSDAHLYFHEGELVIDSDLQVKNWMVYDTMGKTLSSSNQPNLLPNGAYIVKVNFENGQEFQKFLYNN